MFRRICCALFLLGFSACVGNAKGVNSPADTPVTAPAGEPASGGGAATGCAKEIALVCDEGLVDGCLREGGPLTLVHVCTPKDEKAGPPCAQEIMKVCAGGMVDACVTTPPSAATHVCVKR